MAEAQTFVFTYKEVVETLVKKQGIHDGLWQLYFEFSLGAANISSPKGLMPSALVGVSNIGIMKVDEANNLTVDASEVNPLPKKRKRTSPQPPTE